MVLFLLKAHLQRLERHEIRHSKCKWILWLLVCQDRGYAQYKSPTESLPQTRHLHEVMFYLHAFFISNFAEITPDLTRIWSMYHITPVAICMAVGIHYVVMSTEGCGYITAALCTVHKEVLEMLMKYKYIKWNYFLTVWYWHTVIIITMDNICNRHCNMKYNITNSHGNSFIYIYFFSFLLFNAIVSSILITFGKKCKYLIMTQIQ